MTPFKRPTQVTTLPPTIGIKDPEVRAFLDAMVNAWDLRSGVTNGDDKERFVTLGEINRLTNKALTRAFARGSGGAAGGGGGTPIPGEDDINDVIDGMIDSIRKSVLYQLLGTAITPIDLSNLRAKIDASIGEVGAKIIQEQEIRSSADEAFVSQLNIIVGRVAGAEAAITNEQTVRVSKDNALASAINTMWAAIGGSQAVIQDGQLAVVSPSAVQASRWTQVVASVTDPNTGQINSTSIKQDLNSYASKVDGKFNSIYSVRAQVDVGGRLVVGGFGLSATSGAGSTEGPTIDFGVRADRFWIAAPAGSGDVAMQMSPNRNEIPFIVVTNTQTYNGVTYQPGVYMKTAMIANASIGTAKIADAAITNAKIGTAEIDTLKIQGEAITKTRYNTTYITSDISASDVYIVAVYMDIPSSAGVTNVVISGVTTMYPKDNNAVNLQLGIRVNGSELRVVANTFLGGGITTTIVQGVSLWPGSNIIQLTARLLPGEFKSQVGIIGDLIVQSGFR